MKSSAQRGDTIDLVSATDIIKTRQACQAGGQLSDGVAAVQQVAEVEQVAVGLLGNELKPQRAQQHLDNQTGFCTPSRYKTAW